MAIDNSTTIEYPAMIYTPIDSAPFYVRRIVGDADQLKALGPDVFTTADGARGVVTPDAQTSGEYPVTVYTPLDVPPFFERHTVNNADELKALGTPNIFATAADTVAFRDAEANPFPGYPRTGNTDMFDPRKSQPGRDLGTPAVPAPTQNTYVTQGDPGAPAGELKPPAEPPAGPPPADPNAPPHASADPNPPPANPEGSTPA